MTTTRSTILKSTLTTLCTGAVALGMSCTASAETDVNVVGVWSSSSMHNDYEVPFFTQTLPEVSDGELQVQLTTFDQMGIASGDVFRYLSDGLFDIGITFSDYVVSDAPELEGLDLPMLTTEPKQAQEVADAFFPIVSRAMEKRYNAHTLAIVPSTPQVIFCNTPISGLNDLKGKAVRASGRSTAEFLDAIGARSTVMEFNEVPGALERGVIDCAVTGSLSGYAAGWQDVSTYLVPLPVGGWDPAVVAVNGEFWNSLDTSMQQLIDEQAKTVYSRNVWGGLTKDTEQGIACLTGQGKCEHGDPADLKLVDVTDADRERAHQILEETVLPAWAGRVDDATIALWNENVAPLVDLPIKQ